METIKKKLSDIKNKKQEMKKKETIEEVDHPRKKLSKWGKIVLFGVVPVFILLLFLLSYYVFFFPTLTLNGQEEVEVVYPDHYVEEGVTLTRFGKEISSSKVKVKGEVIDNKLGNFQIFYSYQEFLFKKEVKRQVFVVDKESPTLTLNGNLESTVCPSATYKEEGYTAYDNYDGDITDRVTVTKTEEGYTYEVTDSSNNKVTSSRIIHYKDENAPVLALKGTNPMYVKVGSTYQESGVSATDGCDGDITSKVEVSGAVDTAKAGTYEIKYTVTDSSGNTVTATRKVIVYEEGSMKQGVIYLTFDDGPHGTNTARILDVLKKYNVKATFFVTAGGPDSIIKREHDEGHTVALHTASHQYQLVYRSVDDYYNDLNQVHDRVLRITGVDSRIIRFPGGSSNTVSRKYAKGIMTTLTKDVVSKGYKYYDWNISSGDAGNTTSSSVVYQNVVGALRHDRANMVLMHDVKSYTAAAIEDIVVYGLNHGYRFEKITMSTPMITQRVNN